MDWDWINYRHSKRVFELKSKGGKTTKLTISEQARLQVDNFDALNTFATLNLGVAVMPVEFAQRSTREKKLVRLFEDWHFSKGDFFAVWPDKSYRESLVAVFVDFLVANIKSL
jgi:DNA-binding transcriptional LysR family regulator